MTTLAATPGHPLSLPGALRPRCTGAYTPPPSLLTACAR